MGNFNSIETNVTRFSLPFNYSFQVTSDLYLRVSCNHSCDTEILKHHLDQVVPSFHVARELHIYAADLDTSVEVPPVPRSPCCNAITINLAVVYRPIALYSNPCP
jgi:hypothetical protein